MDELDQEEIDCICFVDRLRNNANDYFWKTFNVFCVGQFVITLSVIAVVQFSNSEIASKAISCSSLLYTAWVLRYSWKLQNYKRRFLCRVDNIPTDFQFYQKVDELACMFDAEFCVGHAKRWIVTTLGEEE